MHLRTYGTDWYCILCSSIKKNQIHHLNLELKTNKTQKHDAIPQLKLQNDKSWEVFLQSVVVVSLCICGAFSVQSSTFRRFFDSELPCHAARHAVAGLALHCGYGAGQFSAPEETTQDVSKCKRWNKNNKRHWQHAKGKCRQHLCMKYIEIQYWFWYDSGTA